MGQDEEYYQRVLNFIIFSFGKKTRMEEHSFCEEMKLCNAEAKEKRDTS